MLDDAEIIAWDGEGWGENPHKYVLLANSLGLERRNVEGLHTLEILDVVWRTGVAHPGFHVMYGAGYDWNNWLKDIDYNTAKYVHKNHPVRLGPYTVQYNSMWFEIWRNNFVVKIWDVFRFWGHPFEKALRESFPDFEGLKMIQEFKTLRGDFHEGLLDQMSKYNQYELQGLVMLVEQLFRDMEEAGIQRPNFLTGAGAIAGSLLRQYRVKDHIGSPLDWSQNVLDAIHRGYSAGRIEAWKIGYHRGKFWTHDLRSAYPAAMVHLPCMAEGEWQWRDEFSDDWTDRLSVWNIEWNFQIDGMESAYYPFAYRTKTGNILYPDAGEGWVWWPEVAVAGGVGWAEGFTVKGGWVWVDYDETCLPMAWVAGKYEHRALLKAAGKKGPADELKLGLNSLYGKMCQARGSTADHPPAFHNLAWAGWVTSMTRAKIMEVAAQSPDSVVYMMTDSVASVEHLEVDEGTGLGEWEVSSYDAALVVQAGVGSLWKGTERVDKYRGFGAGVIDPGKVIEKWRSNYENDKFEPLKTTVRRPITLGSAVASEERFSQWNAWVETDRELDLYGGDGKRQQFFDDDDKPWEKLCDLSPTSLAPDYEAVKEAFGDKLKVMTEKYLPKWAETNPYDLEEIDGVMKDTINEELRIGEQR